MKRGKRGKEKREKREKRGKRGKRGSTEREGEGGEREERGVPGDAANVGAGARADGTPTQKIRNHPATTLPPEYFTWQQTIVVHTLRDDHVGGDLSRVGRGRWKH
jgi:hypothetical protein